jgi:hypothetical protein
MLVLALASSGSAALTFIRTAPIVTDVAPILAHTVPIVKHTSVPGVTQFSHIDYESIPVGTRLRTVHHYVDPTFFTDTRTFTDPGTVHIVN